MISVENKQQSQVVDQPLILTLPPAKIDAHYQPHLLANLSPEKPWIVRKTAAEKLGNNRSQDSLPALLSALPSDPFWMVRCAIIQAIEKIGDPRAISTLREVADRDGFQVVRAYAEKAIERLS